jgi:hypothetical protein
MGMAGGAGYDALHFTTYMFVRADGLGTPRARGIVLSGIIYIDWHD